MFEELDKMDFSYTTLDKKCKNCKRAHVLREHYGKEHITSNMTSRVPWAIFMADHLEEDHCTCKEADNGR